MYLLDESYHCNASKEDLDALVKKALQEVKGTAGFCTKEAGVSISRIYADQDVGEREVYEETIKFSSERFGTLSFTADDILQPLSDSDDLGETEADDDSVFDIRCHSWRPVIYNQEYDGRAIMIYPRDARVVLRCIFNSSFEFEKTASMLLKIIKCKSGVKTQSANHLD